MKNLQQYLSGEWEAELAERRAIQQRRADLKKQIAALKAQLSTNNSNSQLDFVH